MLKLFLIILVLILFAVLLIGDLFLTSAALTFAEGVLTFLSVVFLAIIPCALLLVYCYRTLSFASEYCVGLVRWIYGILIARAFGEANFQAINTEQIQSDNMLL